MLTIEEQDVRLGRAWVMGRQLQQTVRRQGIAVRFAGRPGEYQLRQDARFRNQSGIGLRPYTGAESSNMIVWRELLLRKKLMVRDCKICEEPNLHICIEPSRTLLDPGPTSEVVRTLAAMLAGAIVGAEFPLSMTFMGSGAPVEFPARRLAQSLFTRAIASLRADPTFGAEMLPARMTLDSGHMRVNTTLLMILSPRYTGKELLEVKRMAHRSVRTCVFVVLEDHQLSSGIGPVTHSGGPAEGGFPKDMMRAMWEFLATCQRLGLHPQVVNAAKGLEAVRTCVHDWSLR